MTKNNENLTSTQIQVRAFVYDWIVAFSVLFLIAIIVLPPLIWNEESSKVFESRKRMLDLAYALNCYHTLTGEYTDDKNLIIETIMHARDSLVANEYLNGKKDIYMSCSYNVTFIQDSVKGSKKTNLLNLSVIDKKDRLKYIDKTVYDMTKMDDGKYTREYLVPEIDDIKNIPDFISIIQTDYKDTTIKIVNPSRQMIDSIYSEANLIRFYRSECDDTIKVDIPRNFGFMLDTLFSSSTIVSENVVDTIYTLKEPINDDMNNLQTSYVKNQYLFRYIPSNEYDTLWNFGISNGASDKITLDSLHLNKWIIDTTYKLTYIDPEEFTEVEEEMSNNFLRERLNKTDKKSDKNIWKMIECNMNDCIACDWDEINGCIEREEEEVIDGTINGSDSDITDEEWAELFEEFEEELGNEMQFGDTLIVEYSFNSRKISNIEIMNRLINIEDYDRKRYDLNAELLKCPITNQEYTIEVYGNDVYDLGEPFIDKFGNGIYDDYEEFTDELTNYVITSPTKDSYKENRFLIFNFHPGNPGFIKNDEISWENKPAWDFPLK